MIRFRLAFASPRRFLSGRGVVLGAMGALILSVLGGCGAVGTVSTSATKPLCQRGPGAKPQSLNAALSKIDGATVQAWFNRWSAPEKPAISAAEKPARASEIEALTRAHPAWQLADALQRGEILPSNPQPRAASMPLSTPSNLLPSGVSPPGVSPLLPRPSEVTSRPARTLSVRGEIPATSQRAALNRFFAVAQTRDSLRSREEAFLAQRALDETLNAARRGAVSELDLTLVPPDVAAQLTNLRLELVRSLAKTPAERAAAHVQIAEIEARYAQIWSDETARQAEKIRQMLVEMPAQKGREGAAQIARETQASLQTRAQTRRGVAAQLAQTLNSDAARRDDALTLVLPPAPSSSPIDAFPLRTASSEQKNKTSLANLSSARSMNDKSRPLTQTRRFDAALVKRLRDQARRDAQTVARWLQNQPIAS